MDVKKEQVLSFYGSHDASVTFVDKYQNIRVLEYERFVRKRHAMYSSDYDNWELGSNEDTRIEFLKHVCTNINPEEIKIVLFLHLSDLDKNLIKSFFPNAGFVLCNHHTAHAASSFFTSGFEKAFIISIDGGGIENNQVVFTKTFLGEKETLNDLDSLQINLGGPYGYIGCPISEINPGIDCKENSLAYAGKVMGICAYGKIRETWIKPIEDFYKSRMHDSSNNKKLSKDTGLDICFNSLKGEDSYDLAATSQFVFEKIFFDYFWDEIVKLNTDVILTGGCALNVLLNQKLAERLKTINKKLYISPNPNDSGLSMGMFLNFLKLKISENFVYGGLDILDVNKLDFYKKQRSCVKASAEDIAKSLKTGKIIGIIEGKSEIGPRALGNRSIICNPSIKNMKDILNAKVKFREWYRPFAPVCREQDKNIFFENCFESKYMSYAPKVKDPYNTKLPAITHQDGTARLQTVTKKDHELFYNILTEMENIGETPIILNTSFNIKGMPILSSYEDSFYVMDNTELDQVYSNAILFT